MKLIVKLPKGKLPFIGIELPDRYDARELNQELVLEHKYADYRLVFEFIKTQLNLRLISDESLIVKFYNNLDYDSEKLKNWMYLTKTATQFNFGHVKLDKGKEVVVRTFAKDQLFVLKVTKSEILE